MVASQVLIAVCTISFTVAAPQVGSRRTVTTTSQGVSSNPDQIVTSVLSSLQQPIAIAVAEALKGLKTSRTVSTTGSSGIGAGRFSSTGGTGTGTGGARFGVSSGSSKFSTSGSSGASLGSSLTSSLAAGVSQSSSDDIFVRPEYKFEFKVSDDGAQTYISQKEERDGDAVSGSYSYIDANGALVTVNYRAGDMGYTETRDVQDGVVQIRPNIYQEEQVSSDAQITAAQNAAAAQRAAAERSAAAQRAAAERAATAQREASRRAAAERVAVAAQRKAASERTAAAAQRAAAERAASETSSFNSAALISQIISALEPQIGTAVQNALGSTSSSSTITALAPVTTTSAVQAVPSSSSSSFSSSSGQSSGLSSSSSQASGLSSLFGDGGNVVRIATPKFQVEY